MVLRRGIMAVLALGSAEESFKPAELKCSVNGNLWTKQRETQEISLVKRNVTIRVRIILPYFSTISSRFFYALLICRRMRGTYSNQLHSKFFSATEFTIVGIFAARSLEECLRGILQSSIWKVCALIPQRKNRICLHTSH